MKLMRSLLTYGACAALALATVGCGSKAYTLEQTEANTAALGARSFADALGGQYISCSTQDSEPDGYVSCTLKNAKGELMQVSCTYKSAPGCKPA